jgi:heme exporter protein D
MQSIMARRAAMTVVALIVLGLFTQAAAAAGGVSAPQILLAAAACVFGYIVVRLARSMLVDDPVARRRARRGLIFAGVVPALVLTPAALEASPRDYWPMILIAAAVWLAVSMAYTSFILARAGSARVAAASTAKPRPRRHATAGSRARKRALAHSR